jgi:lipoyl(octanoyl) transferase
MFFMKNSLIIRDLGRRDYEPVWREMEAFTRERDARAVDELWFVEHPPVYTQGVGGRIEHVIDPHGIPVIRTNRGGQVTYHGPGQIVAYVLFDIRRRKLNVRQLVTHLEQAVIALLETYGIEAEARADAPGVYVNGDKIAALGLRVSRGCSYHGLALNVDGDLKPFDWINPCGYQGLKVTRMRDLGITDSRDTVREKFARILAGQMGYTVVR